MARRKTVIPASYKTVDMFTGKTQKEESDEIARMLANEDVQEHGKTREPITIESIDNDLKQYMSRGFRDLRRGWRLSQGPSYWYLEYVRDSGSSYGGVYMSSEDMPLLKQMFAEVTCG